MCARRRALVYQEAHKQERNIYKRAWAKQWRDANLEVARAQETQRRKRHMETTAIRNKRFKKQNPTYWLIWRAQHREECRAVYQRWLQSNPDKAWEATLRWRKEHPELVRAQQQRRRAKRVNASGTHTYEQGLARFLYYGGLCWICQQRPANHLDHVIALCNGGTDWPANLRPACSKCNCGKGGWENTGKKTIAEIMAWVALKRRDFGLPWPIKR
ncbi:MAG TPA: HNH endonuclease signature motif containing protein [Ktedonobacterales bacterium]|nr:HNH endonuclease signature motif containing protein [Ktedonobacterales bacterium]